MRRFDIVYFVLLTILAFFIWFRTIAWISSVDDTLPILVALPLFFWLGIPWHLRFEPLPLNLRWIVLGVFLFLLGIGFDLTFFLACGWCCLLWAWLESRITQDALINLKKLMLLPLLAFPWISLDFVNLGWWFRLSGASMTAKIFTLFGADVKQEGTHLVINTIPISVEVACAGLNTLQSMLIAGIVVAFVILHKSQRFWWCIPLLLIFSWIANTLRIIVLSGAALAMGPEFALGAFHTWGGWLVLVMMFALCWVIFSLLEPHDEKTIS